MKIKTIKDGPPDPSQSPIFFFFHFPLPFLFDLRTQANLKLARLVTPPWRTCRANRTIERKQWLVPDKLKFSQLIEKSWTYWLIYIEWTKIYVYKRLQVCGLKFFVWLRYHFTTITLRSTDWNIELSSSVEVDGISVIKLLLKKSLKIIWARSSVYHSSNQLL